MNEIRDLIQGGHTPCHVRIDQPSGLHGHPGRKFHIKWIATKQQRDLLCATDSSTGADHVGEAEYGLWHPWGGSGTAPEPPPRAQAAQITGTEGDEEDIPVVLTEGIPRRPCTRLSESESILHL